MLRLRPITHNRVEAYRCGLVVFKISLFSSSVPRMISSKSKNDEKETKNGVKTTKTEAIGKKATPTTHGRGEKRLSSKDPKTYITNKPCSKEIGENIICIQINTILVGEINWELIGVVIMKEDNNNPPLHPGFQNRSLDQNPLSPSPSLEDLVSKYVNSANNGLKGMEEVQRSKTPSLRNMENQIGKLTRMIMENPPINELTEDARTVTLRSERELALIPIVEKDVGTT
ncbi:hypothetical protein M9H77_30720 [Catharanthus roseus]|uniref:Uncharacterized protein n=1 Tax=Catharanthus roseus TaxID=4058 RepID=A0ACB9ZY11_CATRO|nr:hypothetical protein M9H77_30720 [Catharanthus roseus]